MRGKKITRSHKDLPFSSTIVFILFFFSFHIAAFAHIFRIFYPSPNLLKVAIQGMMEKGEEEENVIKAEN